MSSRRWGTLSLVMAVNALYDLGFGVAILLEHLRLNGVFLLLLAALYALPAVRPQRFHPIAPISAGGRTLGCVVLASAWRSGSPRTFLLLGGADLVLATVTALAWAAAYRTSPSD